MTGPDEPTPPPPGEPEPGSPEWLRPTKDLRRRGRGGWIGRFMFYGVLLGVAFVAGALFFNLVIMPAFVRRGDEVRVPDLTGRDLTAAEALLKPTGLDLGDASRRNDHRPAGTIVAQHPAPGTSVKRGRVVAVVVSLGEKGVGIPRLLGETLQNARIALEQAELRPGDVVSAPCDTLPYNTVIATQPAAGTETGRGAPVHLLVSAGMPRPALVMPDLTGRDLDDIRGRLVDSGFTVFHEREGTIGGPGSEIIRTDPPAGARIRYGGSITLFTR